VNVKKNVVVSDVPVTRGQGLLEGFLAKKRTWMANQLIPSHLREGRVLDIGCGSLPYFLLNTIFAEKYGLDKVMREESRLRLRYEYGVDVVNFDLEEDTTLPFDDRSFDVVVMLAVFEHIEPSRLSVLISEIGRVLKNDGIYIITTPAPWTDVLLKVMAKSGLVSAVEIGEHKAAYNRKKIGIALKESGFKADNICSGYFEVFMNIWVVARKG
jgi:SAM-dependent methyltransferase